MAKFTNIEVAKYLAKRSKAERNFIEMAASDFRKGGKKRKRRTKRAVKEASSTKGKGNGKKASTSTSRPRTRTPEAAPEMEEGV